MSQPWFIYLRIIILVVFLTGSSKIYGQWDLIKNPNATIDTTDYIPFFYSDAKDYNLMIAASKGYSSEIIRLIGKGADIEAQSGEGATPLVFAVSNNRIDAVTTLLSYKPVIDKTTSGYETPLLIAVKSGFFEIAEKLVRAGADLNFQDRNGATPLHYASLYGNLQMADMLLYYNALIDSKATDGTTPLLAAIWAGSTSIADLLVQNKASLEEKDNDGFTPFLLASYFGDTIIMDILYRNGADIYASNKNNLNALALTIMSGETEAAEYLFRIGNTWAAQAQKGVAVDPYTVASRYQRKEMIPVLQSNGIPGRLKYEIDQASLSLSSRLFLHDIYSGLSIAFKEPYTNLGMIAGCDFKLWYTRVLMKSSENLFYQYMNKGSMAYAGIFKDFALSEHPGKSALYLSPSLLAGYSFGNDLKGTIFTPSNKLKAIPAVSLKWAGKDLSVSLGLQYTSSEFYHTGPVWVRFGIAYNYYFDSIRSKIKPPRWFSR